MEARRTPRRSLAPAWVAGAVVVVMTAGGCAFDASGPAGDGSGSQLDDGDSEDDGGDGIEPAECPESLHTVLSVNDLEAAPAAIDPVTTVLLGDTVVLSAAGSCSQRGPVTVEWEIADQELAVTADAGTDSQTLRVYPVLPGDYRVTLTVSDDAGAGEPVSVIALRAFPWVPLAEEDDVRDVAVGAGRVWMASGDGAFFVDLADLEAGSQPVNDVVPGQPDVSDNLSAVYFAGQDGLVWFARRGNSNQVWRVDASTTAVQAIDLPSAEDVRDIATVGPGVMVGARNGVLQAPDNLSFGAPDPAVDVFAVAENAESVWAGGQDLFRVGTATVLSPFAEDDDKIRALAGDGARVWVGSDDQGIARIEGTTLADVYTEADDLPTNKIRALAVDSAGDLWAATDAGVLRYKNDRDVWVQMAEAAGLDGLVDVVGVAVEETADSRFVVIGAPSGTAILGR
jgi:hypothetical protein